MTIQATRRAGFGFGFSFWRKGACAVALVAAMDTLFFFERIGSTAGLFALALLPLLLLVHREIWRRPGALAAIAAAEVYALALFDDPNLLAGGLCFAAAALAILLPRTAAFDDGWRWTIRLVTLLLWVPLRPIRDAITLAQARRRRGRMGLGRLAALLPLPLIGTAVFLLLFAEANPVIAEALALLDPIALSTSFSITRLAFWIVSWLLIWILVRPAAHMLARATRLADPVVLPGVSAGSVTLSLIAFNGLFAVQNLLDAAFLWSGAPLPADMTLAEYAHRGAYPLIATALLAGLFVLVTLSPRSPLAASGTIRRMVYAWIVQNVFLVASTILRTLDYVDAYSLTRLRIAALVWMTLVAVGLLLICVRIWRSRSSAWLINANMASALLALSACSVIDLGSVAAAWNVRHARQIGGNGAALDLCYLNRLEASSLVALVDLEARPLPPELRERVSWSRNRIMDRMETSQSDWHGWTWRDARRLAEAKKRVAERGLPRFAADRRPCDGGPPYPDA